MYEKDKLLSAKKISIGGILLALTVVTLFAESILPASKVSLYALSSFFISVLIIEYGVKTGIVFYISSVLLSLIVVQNKIELIPYIAFFGNYGIVKFFIEKTGKLFIEYVLKIVYFSLWLVLAALFFKNFFMWNIDLKFTWWIIVIVFEIVFIVYDYVYTLFVRFYTSKLKSILKI